MTFDDSVDLILKLEGGYVNDPHDSGGETKFGISKKSYPNEDIRNMTIVRAKEIYRSDYWNPTGARVEDVATKLATAIFDSAVNQGVRWASQALQGILHVRQDGVIGPMTRAALQEAINAHGENWVVTQFMAQRMLRYTQLTQWPRYGFGWSVRLFQVALALNREEQVTPSTTEDCSIYREALRQIQGVLNAV